MCAMQYQPVRYAVRWRIVGGTARNGIQYVAVLNVVAYGKLRGAVRGTVQYIVRVVPHTVGSDVLYDGL